MFTLFSMYSVCVDNVVQLLPSEHKFNLIKLESLEEGRKMYFVHSV